MLAMQRCQRERRKRTRIPFAAWAVGGELGRDRVQMGTRPEWRLQSEPRGLRTRGGELPCRPPAACRTVQKKSYFEKNYPPNVPAAGADVI